MEHYRTYLRAELAQLGRVGDATEFLASGACPAAGRNLPASAADLAREFNSRDQVHAYVARLSDDDLVGLTWCCSRWRHNNVARELARGQAVEFVDVPITAILLNPAERALWKTFERNGCRLTAIARDPVVLDADEYRTHSPGEPVEFPICLAKVEPNTPGAFRLIDGMHRAIQLARNGERTILLCVIRNL